MKNGKDENTDFSLEPRFVMPEINGEPDQKIGDTAANGNTIPERYIVKDIGDGRVLTCLEAPNLSVHITRGFSVSASNARKSPPGTIYLDGCAQSEPFLDHEKKIYNLDHHEGCVRAFTLSTCEQVLVMILKGLDLREREWKVYANEPDMDTIMAVWLIFNHLRISRKEPLHIRFLYALVRLEGVIDALGLELKEFSGLPPDLLRKTQRVIDYLRKDEIQLKKDGLWEEIDFLEYTASILHKIDRIFYKSNEFSDFKGIRELARVDLTDDRFVAVVDADSGIYELERHLNELYGNRLGLVALQKSPGTYTLRRMDLFMPIDLNDVYDMLNLIDPAVKRKSDPNRWGGSPDIGGSPRATGTRLSPLDIAQACRDAVQKPSIQLQAVGLFKSALLFFGMLGAAEIVRMLWLRMSGHAQQPGPDFWASPDFGFVLTLLLATTVVLALQLFRKPWQYGLALPVGKDWWLVLPAVVLLGVLGGLWVPDTILHRPHPYGYMVYFVILIPLVAELLFRGLVHGILSQGARTQYCDSRWFLSWPTVGSAFIYAVFLAYNLLRTATAPDAIFIGWSSGNIFSAFGFGIAAAVVRERSMSVLPAVLFHILAATVVLFMRVFLG